MTSQKKIADKQRKLKRGRPGLSVKESQRYLRRNPFNPKRLIYRLNVSLRSSPAATLIWRRTLVQRHFCQGESASLLTALTIYNTPSRTPSLRLSDRSSVLGTSETRCAQGLYPPSSAREASMLNRWSQCLHSTKITGTDSTRAVQTAVKRFMNKLRRCESWKHN